MKKIQLRAISLEEIREMETHYPQDFANKGEVMETIRLKKGSHVLSHVRKRACPNSLIFFAQYEKSGEVLATLPGEMGKQTAVFFNATYNPNDAIEEGIHKQSAEIRNLNMGRGPLGKYWSLGRVYIAWGEVIA